MIAAERKWLSLMKTLCVPATKASTAWSTLSRCYGEPHRYYHNMHHISSFILALERFGEKDLEIPVWFAAFYHDAKYNPRRHDNEQKSTVLSRVELKALGFPSHWCDQVDALILGTAKHQALTNGPLVECSRIFMDCDMLILGSGPSVYDRYARAIRREYSHIPKAEFRTKRAQLLEIFLERAPIYLTPEIRSLFESQARSNIQREIARLTSCAKTISP